MKLSELISTLQTSLETSGDTEEVALCFVIATKPAHRLDVFGSVSVLHDTAEYPNGIAYLVADCNLQPSKLTVDQPPNAAVRGDAPPYGAASLSTKELEGGG